MRLRSCTHARIEPRASVSCPCRFDVKTRLFMLVSVSGWSFPSAFSLPSSIRRFILNFMVFYTPSHERKDSVSHRTDKICMEEGRFVGEAH